MKIGPAHLFYAAFEKAAGSVENNPLSHSWEGVQYGAKSRMRFLQLAMQGEPKAYVPKGIKFPAPGVYQVSEGSLPSMPSGVGSHDDSSYVSIGANMSADAVSHLQAMGVEVGDQLTFVALRQGDNGNYEACFGRIIVGIGNAWEFTNDPENTLIDMGFNKTGIIFEAPNVACAALILSRGISNGAKRSTAVMTISPDFAGLMNPEAYDKAVESYVTGVTYNSLNSTWYLNQGNTQAFNGEVFFQSLTLPAIEGVAEETVVALLGRQVDGGSVRYVVFTSDGTSAGTIYGRRPNGIATADSWTASRAVAALGNVNVVYAQYTEAIGAQASGNA
jgi:hypothetical protein